MITYKSSDIIKRAEQLADIENSQFISFAEKIALLNEAYVQIYQKSINRDVNDFVRYINTKSSTIQLPPDFYQLKAVTMGNGRFITPVPRRAANASFTDLSYDIINDVLKINGLEGTIVDNICIEYYPVPPTLTFPARNQLIELGNVIDMKGHVYITRLDSTDTDYEDHLYIHNIDDSSFVGDINITGVYDWLIHMEDDYITITNTANTYLYDLASGSLNGTSYKVVVWKGHTYLYDTVSKKLLLPAGNIEVQDLDMDFGNTSIVVLSDDMTKWCGQNYNGGFYIDGVHQGFNASKMYYYKDLVYLCNGTNLLQVHDFQKGTTISSIMQSGVVCVQDINDNTGYGYLGIKMGRHEMISFFDDTVLNFPNNSYFVYMSYLLALAFRQKQGSDTAQLEGLTVVAENTFYDTMVRDDWGLTRITNMYS